jgi:hypothetical protein
VERDEVTVNRALRFAPFVMVVIMFGVFIWGTDFVTLQGEWTIYTVECTQGVWNGDICTGKLAASNRYRFRELKPHKEVLFWTVGSSEPSGRLAPCEIQNRGNWTCKATADSPRSITLAMSRGHPVLDAAANTRPFHAVTKFKWMRLRYGIASQ